METGILLFAISLALIAGLISNRLIRFVKLPNVTAYLIVGILLGPYFFGLFNNNYKGIITTDLIKSFSLLVDLALGFIAFSIGSEFKLKNIKRIGKGIVSITVLQACAALLFVDIGLVVMCLFNNTLKANLPLILTLGAVATATAPAATLMVIKQYKAKGPLCNTLLPVVAFDDAIGLILFSISFSIATVVIKQNVELTTSVSIFNIIVLPLLEILLSLFVGALIGFMMSFSMKFFKSRANRLTIMLASVILGVSICLIVTKNLHLEMSTLLTCMMIGAVFCNLRSDAEIILDGIERFTPPLYMLFFILSGAELNFKIITIPVIGICAVYLIMRSSGKYLGAYMGCFINKKDKNITKYLGLTLLPQAGVAIGMARSASNSLRSIANTLNNNSHILYINNLAQTITAVVLTATLVYELIGPVITKQALEKAGEIN